MITIDLSDKTILITGALGGISAEGIVPRLLEAGARMILTDVVPIEKARAQLAAWDAHRDRLEYRVMDVMDSAATDRAVRGIFEAHPGLNVVLGHAGGCPLHPFAKTPQEEYDRIIHFNLTSQTYLARPVLDEWTTRGTEGHLIFTSTFVSQIPWKDISAYCAAKGGLESFAKCLALEYGKHGIRINCLAPGNVAAGASKTAYENDEEYRNAVDRVSPLGKRNSPGAIGDGFVFLCSHLADEMHGQVMYVDAGVGLPKLV